MTPAPPPPDLDAARATAGMVFHFIASDPAVTELFRRWIEHHPGDLTAEVVIWYLGECHDLISPTCEDAVTHDYRPDRRGPTLYTVPDP